MPDARATLDTFMVDGEPVPSLFRDTLGRLIGSPYPGATRVYGEMVDVLWEEDQSRAAIRLEELWNEAGRDRAFTLLCAYAMARFHAEGQGASFREMCGQHDAVLPSQDFYGIEQGDDRLREIAHLQQRARSLETELQYRKELEGALREALRERARVEGDLRASVQREREARSQAEASDAFKEIFLAILGHDLRNPLNTVLTTVRLMMIRGELAPDSHRRLERVVTSGVRMQRMIEQLLDVTRARLAGGIPIHAADEQDLFPVVVRIVDEIRTANPGRSVELTPPRACLARVDADRFEQVISNLVGNAVTHGDPRAPVRVEVRVRPGAVVFSVHNAGTIPPSVIPTLFDPFRRAARASRSGGLGLGLYISECIVKAHGGRLDVVSGEEGTRFEATLPTR
jgi:signal transduction histidine kinase